MPRERVPVDGYILLLTSLPRGGTESLETSGIIMCQETIASHCISYAKLPRPGTGTAFSK